MNELLEKELKKEYLSHAYILESKNSDYNYNQALEFSKAIFKYFEISPKIEQNSDFFVYGKDELISIDKIRQLKVKSYLKPVNGKIKIFLLHDCQNLRNESANALLKTLEDVNEYCIIILTTTNYYSLIPTVRSRCTLLSLETKDKTEEIDLAKIFEILTAVKDKKLSFYFKNKELFNDKNHRDEIINALISFFKDCLLLKIDKTTEKLKYPHLTVYMSLFEDLEIIEIEKLVDMLLDIRNLQKNNVRFDLAIECFILKIWELK